MAEAVATVFALRFLDVMERRALRRERVFRDRYNALELHDIAFKELFRFPKHIVLGLIDDLRGVLQPPSRRSALTVETRVFAALRFYATGSYQRGIGQELTICLSQRSISKCVRSVSTAIITQLFRQWIKFPENQEELTAVKIGFMEKFNFPGVMGAIDCTHVTIVAPATKGPHMERAFVNRKRAHSLNVQMVSDSNKRILNINARFPGSSHDAYIWSVSNFRKTIMEAHNNNKIDNSWLIGDSGYPLEPWLMTPIANPEPGTGERQYNAAHSKTRYIVECAYGQLKQVWRCLLKHRVLHYSPEAAGNIIVACTILHNMYVEEGLPLPELLPEEENDHIVPPAVDEIVERQRRGNVLATQGRRVQSQLIRNHFSRNR